MTKEKLLSMAARNLKKAQKALDMNADRPGITDQEKENLQNNVEYAQIVYDLLARIE
jgi:hypothetical protein